MDFERREVTKALMAAHDALTTALAIQELPAAPGARIKWLHNGLIWRRVADDQWLPEREGIDFADRFPYPSSHVARFSWEVLK